MCLRASLADWWANSPHQHQRLWMEIRASNILSTKADKFIRMFTLSAASVSNRHFLALALMSMTASTTMSAKAFSKFVSGASPININHIYTGVMPWITLNTLCGSKIIHIPPPWKGFLLRPPHLSGNSSQASYIYLKFWAFENSPPPRNFQSLLWGSMDIFWNYTLTFNSILIFSAYTFLILYNPVQMLQKVTSYSTSMFTYQIRWPVIAKWPQTDRA